MAADYEQRLCLPSGVVLSLCFKKTLFFRHLTQNLNLFYRIHEIQDFQFTDVCFRQIDYLCQDAVCDTA
jgi:hypothetical protein